MSEKIKISLINKTTSEKKLKKVDPSMKLNEFRETLKIENDYVFISDDGKIDIEDEKEFEIKEILKTENNTNFIFIQIDESKKKIKEEEEKKKKEEENKKRIEEEESKRKEEENEKRLMEEEKKALNEEIKLQKDQKYILKCNLCGYTDFEFEYTKNEGNSKFCEKGVKQRFHYWYQNGIYKRETIIYGKEGYNIIAGGAFDDKEIFRDTIIKYGCICCFNGVKTICKRSEGIKWWSFVKENERTIKKILKK